MHPPLSVYKFVSRAELVATEPEDFTKGTTLCVSLDVTEVSSMVFGAVGTQ